LEKKQTNAKRVIGIILIIVESIYAAVLLEVLLLGGGEPKKLKASVRSEICIYFRSEDRGMEY